MSSGPPGRSPNTSTNNGNSNNSHYQYHQSQRSSRRSSHSSMLGIDTSVSSSNHHDRGGHHSGGHNHHHHSDGGFSCDTTFEKIQMLFFFLGVLVYLSYLTITGPLTFPLLQLGGICFALIGAIVCGCLLCKACRQKPEVATMERVAPQKVPPLSSAPVAVPAPVPVSTYNTGNTYGQSQSQSTYNQSNYSSNPGQTSTQPSSNTNTGTSYFDQLNGKI